VKLYSQPSKRPHSVILSRGAILILTTAGMVKMSKKVVLGSAKALEGQGREYIDREPPAVGV